MVFVLQGASSYQLSAISPVRYALRPRPFSQSTVKTASRISASATSCSLPSGRRSRTCASSGTSRIVTSGWPGKGPRTRAFRPAKRRQCWGQRSGRSSPGEDTCSTYRGPTSPIPSSNRSSAPAHPGAMFRGHPVARSALGKVDPDVKRGALRRTVAPEIDQLEPELLEVLAHRFDEVVGGHSRRRKKMWGKPHIVEQPTTLPATAHNGNVRPTDGQGKARQGRPADRQADPLIRPWAPPAFRGRRPSGHPGPRSLGGRRRPPGHDLSKNVMLKSALLPTLQPGRLALASGQPARGRSRQG